MNKICVIGFLDSVIEYQQSPFCMWHLFSSMIELAVEEISLTMMHNLKILGTGAFSFHS